MGLLSLLVLEDLVVGMVMHQGVAGRKLPESLSGQNEILPIDENSLLSLLFRKSLGSKYSIS